MSEDKQPKSRIQRVQEALRGDRDRMVNLQFRGLPSRYKAALGTHKDVWHRTLSSTIAWSTKSRLDRAAWAKRLQAYEYHLPPYNHEKGYNVKNLLDEAPLRAALDAIPEDEFESLMVEWSSSCRVPNVKPTVESDLRTKVLLACSEKLEMLFELLGLCDDDGNLYLHYVDDAQFSGPEKSKIYTEADSGWFLEYKDKEGKQRAFALLVIEAKAAAHASVTAGGHFSGNPDLFRSEEERSLLERKRNDIDAEVFDAFDDAARARAQLKIPNACEEFYEAMHQSAATAIPHGGTIWGVLDIGGLTIVERKVDEDITQPVSLETKPVTLPRLHLRDTKKRLNMDNMAKQVYDTKRKYNWYMRFLHESAKRFDGVGRGRRIKAATKRIFSNMKVLEQVEDPPRMNFDTIISLHNEDKGGIYLDILLVLVKSLVKNLPQIQDYWNQRKIVVQAYDMQRRLVNNEEELKKLKKEFAASLKKVDQQFPTFRRNRAIEDNTQSARQYFNHLWEVNMFEIATDLSSRVGGEVMCQSDFKWGDPLQEFLRDDIKSSDVYDCSSPKLANGEVIVLKLIHPDNRGAFLSEVRALKRLNSVPSDQRYYWPRLYSYGTMYSEDMTSSEPAVHLYIAMEYIKARVHAPGELDPEEVLDQLQEDCFGELMEHGIVHTDVRIENAIYTEDDQGPLYKAIDFGRCEFLFELPGDEVFYLSEPEETDDESDSDQD